MYIRKIFDKLRKYSLRTPDIKKKKERNISLKTLEIKKKIGSKKT